VEVSALTYVPANPGDYNLDGVIDGAEFLASQRQLGSVATPFGGGADGSVNGIVDAPDLTAGRGNFGASNQSVAVTATSVQAFALVADGDSVGVVAVAVVEAPLNKHAAASETERAIKFAAFAESEIAALALPAHRSWKMPPRVVALSTEKWMATALQRRSVAMDYAVEQPLIATDQVPESLAIDVAARNQNATTTDEARARLFAALNDEPANSDWRVLQRTGWRYRRTFWKG
jgi:hypothetical protein